jgi:hypothetical protein
MSHTIVIDPLAEIFLVECANLKQAVGWGDLRGRRGERRHGCGERVPPGPAGRSAGERTTDERGGTDDG